MLNWLVLKQKYLPANYSLTNHTYKKKYENKQNLASNDAQGLICHWIK